jgi:hypothetical protein
MAHTMGIFLSESAENRLPTRHGGANGKQRKQTMDSAMAYAIFSFTAYNKTLVATLETFAEAEIYAVETMKAEFFEEDADHPGCADFFARGEVYSLQPVGFKLVA